MQSSSTRLVAAAVAVVGIAAVIAAGTASASSSSKPTVLAAASLTQVFPKVDANANFTFAGSGGLETDIEQGAPADVYAAANAMDPAQLYAKKLVDKPIEFATNYLVMIVPASNPAHLTSVNGITKKGVKIVVCNAAQPCGDYASTVWANLGITKAATKNVVSYETDVTQVLAEIELGQADVGFVYYTDAKSAGSKVKIIDLPAKAMPGTTDWIAIVEAGKHQAAAKAFVDTVLSAKGQATLKAAGFGKP
jgi:molybdate transport system substrate-binding protein